MNARADDGVIPTVSPFRLFAVIISVFLAKATSAQTDVDETVPPIEPQAVELLTSAADFLAAQPAFSFDWFVSYDDVIDGREKLTFTRSGSNLILRDEGFYSFSQTGEDTREYYFDGSKLVIADVEEDAYVMAPFDGDFDALVDRIALEYDLHLPIWEIMSRDPGAALLRDASTAAYLGTTSVAGHPAHHLAFASYDRDWQIWISTDPELPVLMMIVGTDPYAQGWPQYRAYFMDWNFAPEVEAESFQYFPGENSDRMVWPKVNSEILGEADSLPSDDPDADPNRGDQ